MDQDWCLLVWIGHAKEQKSCRCGSNGNPKLRKASPYVVVSEHPARQEEHCENAPQESHEDTTQKDQALLINRIKFNDSHPHCDEHILGGAEDSLYRQPVEWDAPTAEQRL